MQNKTAIWVFLFLILAACAYQISFTFINQSVVEDAEIEAQRQLDSAISANPEISEEKQAEIFKNVKSTYLDNKGSDRYLGLTFDQVRKKQINRGLDLQGGMNVTLEVSIVDMLRGLVNNPEDEQFQEVIDIALERQTSSDKDFISLFDEVYSEKYPSVKYASIFHSRDNVDLIPRESTNEEVIEILQREAAAAISRTEEVVRKRIDNIGVVQPKVQKLGAGRILVELPGIDDSDEERVEELLEGAAKLEFWEGYDNRNFINYLINANNTLAAEAELKKAEKEDAEVVEESGSSEETADIPEEIAETEVKIESPQEGEKEEAGLLDDINNGTPSLDDMMEKVGEGGNKASSLDDIEDEDRSASSPLFKLLGPAYDDQNGAYEGAIVGYANKKDKKKIMEMLNRPDITELFPVHKFFWSKEPVGDSKIAYALYAAKPSDQSLDLTPALEGDIVSDARAQTNQMGRPEVTLSMKPNAASQWEDITRNNIGKPILIVMDDNVYSAPVVQNTISGGNTVISGSFSVQETNDLAGILKSGKLEVPSKIIEKAKVGPTLGAANIKKSFISFLVALGLVLVYMLFYYNRAGLVANIALVTNMFLIVGFLASLGSTVTLAGIAGIVLTIGMSVDANVIIFERIREEISQGKGIKLAIQDGYKNSLWSILDANFTTAFVGIILLIFGTGPIQSFAVTLLIGIATSLFSAVIVSRLVFDLFLKKSNEIKFDTAFSRKIFKNPNIQFINKRKIFYGISAIAIVISLGSIFTNSLDFGVDFTGGRSYVVKFENDINSAEAVKNLLQPHFGDNAPDVKTYGSDDQLLIITKYNINQSGSEGNAIVREAMEAGLGELNNPFTIESSQMVGPTIADDIKQASYKSTLLALIIMFIYIVFRFGKWQFGLGAVTALFHDVIIVLGIFSLLYKFVPFSLEINQAFIAAILTVVGYSVNDTVIIFDRIREVLGLHKREDKKVNVNNALNLTLSRTFNTSITTFMVLLLIFLFGGDSIKGFVFGIMVGVIIGTYSSIFIATPVMLDLDNTASKSQLKGSKKKAGNKRYQTA